MESLKKLLLGLLLLSLSTNLSWSQDIPFTERFFPNKSEGLRLAIVDLKNGDEYFFSGRPEIYKFAIPYYESAAKFNDSNADLNMKLGACHLMAGKKLSALMYLQKSINLNAVGDPTVYYYLGRTYQMLLKWDEAIVEYLKYLELLKGKEPIDAVNRRIEECKNGKELIQHPINVTIENLGVAINTRNQEYNPLITADESSIFFTSRRPGGTSFDVDPEDLEPYEDIYTSDKVNGKWTLARNMGTVVNTITHDAAAGLSPDGHILFVFKGDRNNGDILMSYIDKGEWTKPIDPGKNINTKYHESSACLSPDGNTMYFSSDRPGGYGGRDLYKSQWDPIKKLWGPAVNLGGVINTSFDEEGVFMHPGGVTLYFSSKGHNSMGGYDVFYTAKENENWHKPTNVGYPVNTPDDDVYFVVAANGNNAYYASVTDNGYGEKDLLKVTFLSEADKPLTKMSVLKGYITEASTRMPVAAYIELIDLDKQERIGSYITDSKTGKYLVSLPSGRKYGAFVYADGYLFESSYFDIPDSASFREIEKNIEMKSLEAGNNIVLNNIFFDTDKTDVKNESHMTLLSVVRLMKEYPTLFVEISGHTDTDGKDDYNLQLSETRAKNVVDFLIANGIPKERLSYKGYGETKPIAPNDSPEGKAKNRRIEFRITSR
ncbi:MAG TPA: OmpA family protein [Bacteroidia bacterium]|nr:OmpA family protein [Bacteroidia bacterium]